MAKSSYSQPSYYYGMPDMYMQMGYFPFPTPPAPEQTPNQVMIPYAMSMSSHCRYFLGQTDKIDISGGAQGFGALVNPLRSGVQLYVNDWYVSNFSDQAVEMQIWFGPARSVVGAKASSQITPGFVQLSPCPAPHGQLLFSSADAARPSNGSIASTRILPPMTSIGAEKSGHWILAPGTAMMVHVPAQSERESGEMVFAIGWWEQPVFG